MEKDLVYIDEYGLLGSNFYWKHRDKIEGVTATDLNKVGLYDERVQVDRTIIDILVKIDTIFQKKGWRMYVKEGYRPKALYRLVYEKRVELFGKEETDRLLNMNDMPHATGRSVDIALWDPKTDSEIYMRKGEDGTDALFVDFYKDRVDEEGKHYQELQEFVIATMQSHGFRLGTKREYFHFDYKPEVSPNYQPF